MIGFVIKFVLGYVLWHVVPGMITAAHGKTKQIIDLVCQIIGIFLMIVSVIDVIKYIIH